MQSATYAPLIAGGPHAGAFRAPAVGRNGVVAAAHGLAATAGLRALIDGGTAVDAAVAVGAALGVVEPFMSGIGGGGGSMLIYEAATHAVHVLDYLGPAPAAADATAFSSVDEIDADVRSATVPAVLAAWLTAHQRFGRLERAALFQPAIDLAENGWPLSPWAAGIFRDYAARLNRHGSVYAIDADQPAAGAVVTQPDLARSYRLIGASGGDVFYRGELGQRLVASVRAAGGWLSESDLAGYTPRWSEPLTIDYRGWTVHTPPPPSTGFQYLACLKMLEATDLTALQHNSAEYLHLVLETIKLASADRTRYASAEPSVIDALLSDEYAARRRPRRHAARGGAYDALRSGRSLGQSGCRHPEQWRALWLRLRGWRHRYRAEQFHVLERARAYESEPPPPRPAGARHADGAVYRDAKRAPGAGDRHARQLRHPPDNPADGAQRVGFRDAHPGGDRGAAGARLRRHAGGCRRPPRARGGVGAASARPRRAGASALELGRGWRPRHSARRRTSSVAGRRRPAPRWPGGRFLARSPGITASP